MRKQIMYAVHWEAAFFFSLIGGKIAKIVYKHVWNTLKSPYKLFFIYIKNLALALIDFFSKGGQRGAQIHQTLFFCPPPRKILNPPPPGVLLSFFTSMQSNL